VELRVEALLGGELEVGVEWSLGIPQVAHLQAEVRFLTPVKTTPTSAVVHGFTRQSGVFNWLAEKKQAPPCAAVPQAPLYQPLV
jgi:hypothetical protein